MSEAVSRGMPQRQPAPTSDAADEPIVQPPMHGVEMRPAMKFSAPPRVPAEVIDQQGGGVSKSPSDAEREAVMAERRQRWADAGGDTASEPAEAAAAEPYEEPPDSVEFQLPSGKVVDYGPRRGSNLSWDVAALLGPQSDNTMLAGVVKVALCVRGVDGKRFEKPTDLIGAKKIANLFDEGELDAIFAIHTQTWRPLLRSQLPLVKKIFR